MAQATTLVETKLLDNHNRKVVLTLHQYNGLVRQCQLPIIPLVAHLCVILYRLWYPSHFCLYRHIFITREWHFLVFVNGQHRSVAVFVFLLVILTSFLQIVKPLWPFIVGSAVTFYLISKAQSSGIRCKYLTHDLKPSLLIFFQLLNGVTTLATRMLPNLPKSLYTRCDVTVGQSRNKIVYDTSTSLQGFFDRRASPKTSYLVIFIHSLLRFWDLVSHFARWADIQRLWR